MRRENYVKKHLTWITSKKLHMLTRVYVTKQFMPKSVYWKFRLVSIAINKWWRRKKLVCNMAKIFKKAWKMISRFCKIYLFILGCIEMFLIFFQSYKNLFWASFIIITYTLDSWLDAHSRVVQFPNNLC